MNEKPIGIPMSYTEHLYEKYQMALECIKELEVRKRELKADLASANSMCMHSDLALDAANERIKELEARKRELKADLASANSMCMHSDLALDAANARIKELENALIELAKAHSTEESA